MPGQLLQGGTDVEVAVEVASFCDTKGNPHEINNVVVRMTNFGNRERVLVHSVEWI